MMPDTYEVMRARRRAFSSGARPPGAPYWETAGRVVFPGFQPHEIAKLAKDVRRRIAKWRARRAAASSSA